MGTDPFSRFAKRGLSPLSLLSCPMHLRVNGDEQTVGTDLTVAQLLEHLKLVDRPCAVEVNLAVVPRARHAEHRLREGDAVEIVTLVGGG